MLFELDTGLWKNIRYFN